MEAIRAKGLRWNANRINDAPQARGLFVIFNEKEKTFQVSTTDNLMQALRAEWWKHNFWYFSWFHAPKVEQCEKLKKKFEKMSYDDLWNFTQEIE